MAGHPGAPSILVATVAIAGGVAFVGSLAFGVVAYSVWFGVAIGPWSADSGLSALAIDTALFSGFALHHSLFARTGMRHWVADRVSPTLERTVYVWIASALFAVLCWTWRPIPGLAWQVPTPWSAGLTSLQILGVWLSLHGARQLDVWDLAGLRQALGRERPSGQTLVRGGLYRLVRHPIYLGWTLMVWPAATMTGTRLAFAALSTAYLVVAIPFEERTLRRDYGPSYEAYARQVRWRMVPFVY
jgi:protein-S-isoprenylcysteine O-methyltransferase Ste14